MQGDTHVFDVTVYYEDTDMAGIVYHANYLKFIERARSDWVKAQGLDQNAMREKDGIVSSCGGLRRITLAWRNMTMRLKCAPLCDP